MGVALPEGVGEVSPGVFENVVFLVWRSSGPQWIFLRRVVNVRAVECVIDRGIPSASRRRR